MEEREEMEKKESIMDRKNWVLEYSTYQKCFHIDTIERVKEMNIQAVIEGRCNGYVIVAGPDTYDKITKFGEEMEKDIKR